MTTLNKHIPRCLCPISQPRSPNLSRFLFLPCIGVPFCLPATPASYSSHSFTVTRPLKHVAPPRPHHRSACSFSVSAPLVTHIYSVCCWLFLFLLRGELHEFRSRVYSVSCCVARCSSSKCPLKEWMETRFSFHVACACLVEA